jgi:hypothetical protein
MASKSLFDHIKAVTSEQDPKYWDKLDEADKKVWSNYMVFRFLSMNYEWVDTIAQLQPVLQELPPRACYLALIDIIPRGKYYLKYMKAKGEDRHEKWLIELVSKHYQSSLIESEDYLDIYYASKFGQENLLKLIQKYGVDEKLVKKLKLKV